MAQVCGGSSGDYVWAMNVRRAEYHLWSACDRWLWAGEAAWSDKLPPDRVADLVVHDLVGDCYYGGSDNLDAELPRADTIEANCRRRRAGLSADDVATIATLIRTAVRDAALGWLTHGLTAPTYAEVVVFDIARVLYDFKLVRRPPTPVK